MRRFAVFLILLVASLIALTVVLVAGVLVFASSSFNWASVMSGMMGTSGMMNETNQTGASSSVVTAFGVAFIVLIIVVIVGVVCLAYYVAVPEIRSGVTPVFCGTTPQKKIIGQELEQEVECTLLESIVKTLSDEERKVIEVLIAHDGKYLQKYIRNQAGLSRLKTHRILARLAERGIVMLEKTGNTNQVLLADWLKK